MLRLLLPILWIIAVGGGVWISNFLFFVLVAALIVAICAAVAGRNPGPRTTTCRACPGGTRAPDGFCEARGRRTPGPERSLGWRRASARTLVLRRDARGARDRRTVGVGRGIEVGAGSHRFDGGRLAERIRADGSPGARQAARRPGGAEYRPAARRVRPAVGRRRPERLRHPQRHPAPRPDQVALEPGRGASCFRHPRRSVHRRADRVRRGAHRPNASRSTTSSPSPTRGAAARLAGRRAPAALRERPRRAARRRRRQLEQGRPRRVQVAAAEPSYHCGYAKEQIAIKTRYMLSVTRAEKTALQATLRSCVAAP